MRYVILREVKGYHFSNFLILLEGYKHGIFHGGDSCVWVLLLEYLRDGYPGIGAEIVRKETPSPLPVGCLTDGLPKLPIQKCAVKLLVEGFVVLLLYQALRSNRVLVNVNTGRGISGCSR